MNLGSDNLTDEHFNTENSSGFICSNPLKASECTGARATAYKWVYDESSNQCKKLRACAGFDTRQICESTCGKPNSHPCLIFVNFEFSSGTIITLHFATK